MIFLPPTTVSGSLPHLNLGKTSGNMALLLECSVACFRAYFEGIRQTWGCHMTGIKKVLRNAPYSRPS